MLWLLEMYLTVAFTCIALSMFARFIGFLFEGIKYAFDEACGVPKPEPKPYDCIPKDHTDELS